MPRLLAEVVLAGVGLVFGRGIRLTTVDIAHIPANTERNVEVVATVSHELVAFVEGSEAVLAFIIHLIIRVPVRHQASIHLASLKASRTVQMSVPFESSLGEGPGLATTVGSTTGSTTTTSGAVSVGVLASGDADLLNGQDDASVVCLGCELPVEDGMIGPANDLLFLDAELSGLAGDKVFWVGHELLVEFAPLRVGDAAVLEG